MIRPSPVREEAAAAEEAEEGEEASPEAEEATPSDSRAAAFTALQQNTGALREILPERFFLLFKCPVP
jgi:hypothetical protein